MFRIMRWLWPRSLWAKCIVSLLVLVGVAIASAAGYCAFIMLQGKWELQKVIAEIEDEDPDWTFEAIEKQRYMPMSAANAFWILENISIDTHYRIRESLELWEQATEEFHVTGNNQRLPRHIEGMLKEDFPTFQEEIEQFRQFQHIDNGYPISPIKDRRGYERSTDRMADAIDLLQWDAIFWTSTGQYSEAANDLTSALYATRLLRDCIGTDEKQYGCTTTVRLVAQVQWTLNQGVLDDKSLELLQRATTDGYNSIDLARHLRDLRADLHLQYSEGNLQSLYRYKNDPPDLLETVQSRLTASSDQAAILDLYAYCIGLSVALRDRNNDSQKIIDQMNNRINAMTAHLKDRDRFPDRVVYTDIDINFILIAQTMLRLATVAIACERHRLRHGSWPESLEAIPKEVLTSIPTDPFTGGPVKYKREKDGILVYSDWTLDEGNTPTDKSNAKSDGLGRPNVRLWDPEVRGVAPRP